MKIGNYYKDTNTGLLLRCINFTHSYYVWVDTQGNMIDEEKLHAWKHVESRSVRNEKLIEEKFRVLFRTNNPYLCLNCCGTGHEITEYPEPMCKSCGGTGKIS